MDFVLNGSIDLVTAGEVLVDIISSEYDQSLKMAVDFKKNFGGSPANIASNVGKQGFKVSMITAIGQDDFGKFLKENLEKNNVNTDYIKVCTNSPTSLVFVTKSKGNPSFIAYRCADKYIEINKKEYELIDKCKIFHVSSFAFSKNPARDNLLDAIKYAREKKKLVCIDPNFREIMWDDDNKGVEFMKRVIGYSDIIKPSEEDALHILGKMSIEEYCKEFYNLGPKLIMMTLGGNGMVAYDGKEFIEFPTLANEVVDTTGAGDAFWSGFYCGILMNFQLKRAMKLGSAFSAYKLKYLGAVVELPSIEKIIKLYKI